MREYGTTCSINFTVIKSESRSIVRTLKVYESHIHVDRRCRSFVSNQRLVSTVVYYTYTRSGGLTLAVKYSCNGVETIVESGNVYLVHTNVGNGK